METRMVGKLQRALPIIIFLFPIFGSDTTLSAGREELFCVFETIDVPCTRLARQKLFVWKREVVRRLRYKPMKAIPMWPNDDILGGPDPDHSTGEPPKDAYFNRVDSRSQRTVITALNVELYNFGEGFVDPGFGIPEFRELTDTDSVYLGDKVFELWTKALERGVVCGKSTVDESDGSDVRDCAFVRKRTQTPRRIILEYCLFTQNSNLKIPGEAACMDVARDTGRKKSILASEYVYFGGDLGYGGGEGRYECHLNDVNPETIKSPFIDFIKSEVGGSASVSESESRYYPGTTRVQAGVLNVHNSANDVWVRIYLDAYVGPQRNENEKTIPGSEFEISTNFTISVRASDDVTDYREPNPSMGNRLRNDLQSRAKLLAAQFSKTAKCSSVGL
jgi:hypothetical protein